MYYPFAIIIITSSSAIAERRAAVLVIFGQNIGGRLYFAPNVVGSGKLKALIFYAINPLVYEKRSLCAFEPLFGGRLRATNAVHLRLTGKSP